MHAIQPIRTADDARTTPESSRENPLVMALVNRHNRGHNRAFSINRHGEQRLTGGRKHYA